MHPLEYLLPVIVVCAGSLTLLMLGLWVKDRLTHLILSLGTLIIAACCFCQLKSFAPQSFFSGLIVHDAFGMYFSVFALFATGVALLSSYFSNEISEDRRSEFYAIMLALCSGLIFMGVSTNFLMIYLALETVSILSYTLAGFNKMKSQSVEASMKYVVYGSLASALMVFGMSFIFGVVGSVNLFEVREFFAATPTENIPLLLWTGVLLSFAGLGYKISAAPMHMWTPDVYEGAPTPVSAFLSVAPKAAGLALLIRFFVVGFSSSLEGVSEVVALNGEAISFHVAGKMPWTKFLVLSSIFTMFLGNLAALGQSSVKRILAYSSIAHAGYMLMGITTQSFDGIAAVNFYIVVYCLMNLGAFWVVSLVEEATGGEKLQNFKGLIYRKPLLAICMCVFLFSLVGLPPFAGFIGKLYLFKAILARELYLFALIAAVNSVISFYYYSKILKAMCFEGADGNSQEWKVVPGLKVASVFIVLLAVPNLIFGIYWEPIMKWSRDAVSFFNGGL